MPQTYRLITDPYGDLPRFTSCPFEAASDELALEQALSIAKLICNPKSFALDLFRLPSKTSGSDDMIHLGKIATDVVARVRRH